MIVEVLSKILTFILYFVAINELLNFFVVVLSPHKDTALRHFLNIVVLVAGAYYLPRVFPHTFWWLVYEDLCKGVLLVLNLIIFRYLRKIKYYS